jgi:hypothetical protein
MEDSPPPPLGLEQAPTAKTNNTDNKPVIHLFFFISSSKKLSIFNPTGYVLRLRAFPGHEYVVRILGSPFDRVTRYGGTAYGVRNIDPVLRYHFGG